MLRIKGYPGTSNFPIHSFYRIQNQILLRQGLSNTFILPNIKSNRFTYHVSHQGTSSNFPFIKLVGIQTKISFPRRSHSNTFILPNTKPNRFTYIMFRIKGQVKTSHLSNLQAYRLKYYFRDKVIPILSFYRIQNQIGSHIMFRIKGQVQTSHLSNLQAYRLKYHYRAKSFQYFHSTEYKTKQVHVSCFASRDKFKFPIYQTCRHIDQNRFFATKSFQYFHFTEYKIKQAYISCFASRDKFKHLI